MTKCGELLPPQLHAASLNRLVDLYVQAGLDGGDLATIGPLRLLRDRVEFLLAEHARLAHEVDERPWREIGDARASRRRRGRRGTGRLGGAGLP